MVQATQISGASRAEVSWGTATATMVESIEFMSTALTARTKKTWRKRGGWSNAFEISGCFPTQVGEWSDRGGECWRTGNPQSGTLAGAVAAQAPRPRSGNPRGGDAGLGPSRAAELPRGAIRGAGVLNNLERAATIAVGSSNSRDRR